MGGNLEIAINFDRYSEKKKMRKDGDTLNVTVSQCHWNLVFFDLIFHSVPFKFKNILQIIRTY